MGKKSKSQSNSLQLSVIRPCCAAVDVGSMMMMISYSDSDGKQHLLEVDAFTEGLKNAAETLKKAGVTAVAMEATGIYWIAIYDLFEQYGFKMTLVNPKHFKNVDGQKTDVKDCQWLHQLHAHGLLKKSHIAAEVFRELRSYLHERNILQNQKSETLNRIQKLLDQMNVKVQHIISDIEGVSGMKLLRCIASGLTNPAELLSCIEVKRLKASKEDLLKSLDGVYKDHLTCILQITLRSYDFYKEQMLRYEQLIETILQKLLPEDENGTKASISAKTTYTRKNEYHFNIREYLNHIVGVDLTAIEGIDEISVLTIIAVTGLDMSKWATAEHFTSWLNLSPRPKKSGNKVIGHDRRFTNNRATQAFRMAAQSMWQNKGSLGQLYRRLSAQKGSMKAIKAIARKLAVIFYHMIKNKTEYDKNKLRVNTERQKTQKMKHLEKEAKKYGYTLQRISA